MTVEKTNLVAGPLARILLMDRSNPAVNGLDHEYARK